MQFLISFSRQTIEQLSFPRKENTNSRKKINHLVYVLLWSRYIYLVPLNIYEHLPYYFYLEEKPLSNITSFPTDRNANM